MTFIADLHIHSRFSRATAKSLAVPTLAGWAACKGIQVLGSGDFTHPAWRKELAENLVFDEASGLYRPSCPPELPRGQDIGTSPLFCLQAEISSIYKRGGKTRKIHNLVFMPDLEAVERLCRRLELVGNLKSDGRPILGLDSRDLLEMVLECSDEAVMIPAHIWTPWFSLFGSKSGFDSLEECYGDLSSHIFALETGLSSDPEMNRLLSALDKYVLVSNSDAHSGANLGREGNLFAGAPSYQGIFSSLRACAEGRRQSGAACEFLGTLEFYPEEGKYHLDGHRACNVSLEPAQSRELGNICPVCGKPLTIGVLHRVMELADRDAAPVSDQDPEVRMLIPLAEVLAEIYETGSSSKRVGEAYYKLLHELGPELDILCEMPLERIFAFWEPLGEAISRMRAGKVEKTAGFDGQFGKIRVFSAADMRQIRWGNSALLPGLKPGRASGQAKKPALKIIGPEKIPTKKQDSPIAWTAAQLEALKAQNAPVFVAAGPGAGKTRVLVGRIGHLLENGIEPRKILAITFTRRAAAEMRQRLAIANPDSMPVCDTLHALAHSLRSKAENLPAFSLLPEDSAKNLFASANSELDKRQIEALWREISLAHEKCQPLPGEARVAADNYAAAKKRGNGMEYLDYNDLLSWLLENADTFRGSYEHILVDEIQDFSTIQLEIVKRLLPENGQGFFGIGDPDQAIYGFRGASGQNERGLKAIWPNLEVFRLGQSFRSGQKILDLARRVLDGNGQCGQLSAALPIAASLHYFSAPDEGREADWIGQKIMSLLGSTSHTLLDESGDAALAPGDIAVLVRLKAQIPLIAKTLETAGIPCQAPSSGEFWADEACSAFIELVAGNLGFAPQGAVQLPFLHANMPPDDILEKLSGNNLDILGDLEIFGKSAAFNSMCRLWKKCAGWKTFYEELAWLNEAELIAAKAEKVRVLTMHSSKGLEFEAVFLPGLENGLLPFSPEIIFADRQAAGLPALDEERRLLYVGVTRAARFVYCSSAANRRFYGRRLELVPSPFLDNMRGLMQCSRLVRHAVVTHEALPLIPGIDAKKKSR